MAQLTKTEQKNKKSRSSSDLCDGYGTTEATLYCPISGGLAAKLH